MKWFLVVFLTNNPFPLVDWQPSHKYCLAAQKQFLKEHRGDIEVKQVTCMKADSEGNLYERYERHR